MHTVSCIIPAYNESKRIGQVLAAASANPLISEIIVIDDGSEDTLETKMITEQYPSVRFIAHAINQGKSKAVHTGISHATGKYLLFLDADLIGLTSEDLSRLIVPVIEDRVAMTISMRKNSPWIDRKLGIDFISGERVFARNFLDTHLEKIPELAGFSLESFLNTIIVKEEKPIMVIFWKDVISPYPIVKKGLWVGLKGMTTIVRDVIRVSPVYKIPYVFYKLMSLRIPEPNSN